MQPIFLIGTKDRKNNFFALQRAIFADISHIPKKASTIRHKKI